MSFSFSHFLPSSARFAAGRRTWFKMTLAVARDLIYNSDSCIGYVFLLFGPENGPLVKSMFPISNRASLLKSLSLVPESILSSIIASALAKAGA